MTVAIFMIAAVPAYIAYWLGTSTGSQTGVLLCFLVAGAFGVMTGSPEYMGIDLLFSFIGYLLARSTVKDMQQDKKVGEYLRKGQGYGVLHEPMSEIENLPKDQDHRDSPRNKGTQQLVVTQGLARTLEIAPIRQPYYVDIIENRKAKITNTPLLITIFLVLLLTGIVWLVASKETEIQQPVLLNLRFF